MIVAIPVIDGHELTEEIVKQALATKVLSTTKIVIVDNDSDTPYDDNFMVAEPDISVISLEENVGYYQPLKLLHETYPQEEFIGLMHNDLVMRQGGWDHMLETYFANDPELGLIGLCGSREVDERGGRGGHTACNFMGGDVRIGDMAYKGQSPDAGKNITELEPAIVLDSLFMMFRRDVVPELEAEWSDWDDITLAHFYDRIWPIRTIEAGYHVATAPIACDHIGGLTTTANQRYRDDCIAWLEQREIEYENPETEMYLVAERRYLNEYREEKHFLPAIIEGSDYAVRHLHG